MGDAAARPEFRNAPRLRDRQATERRILEAARQLIARDGFQALGVNALAAAAGCDKKLIARYFGDLDGVVAALGGALGFWLGEASALQPQGAYGERMAALLRAYAEALRGNPLLQRVLAWELVQPTDTLRRLEAARSQTIGAWMAGARGAAAPPAGVDAPAINAVLLAALHYLTLREQTLQRFAGLDLSSPEGRARVDKAMTLLLERAYADH